MTQVDADRGEASRPEGAGEREEKVSRSGRNLPAAITVGIVLGAAVLASLFTVRHLFLVIIAAAIIVGTTELALALRRAAGIRIVRTPVLLGGQAMIWFAWPFGLPGAMIAFVLTVLVCLLWRLPSAATGYVRDVTASVFVAAYVALSGAFAAMLVIPEDGVGRVLSFLIVVIACDTGGYLAGILGGRHPMAPVISPKKTWEGFAGSLAAGILGGGLSCVFLLGAQAWQGMVFGLVIVLTATLGDLVASVIKRDLGVKDMAHTLPGHGGLMDRLDSLLPSAVASWLLLSLFLPV